MMTARFANNNPMIITHRYNFFRNIFCCNSRILALAESVICLIDSKCCPVSSNFSRWNLISSAVRSPITSVSCAILALSSNNRVVSCGASLNPLVFLFFILQISLVCVQTNEKMLFKINSSYKNS